MLFSSAKPKVTKQIENWKVVPTSDGTVSLIGYVGGLRFQTTPIQRARAGEVMTENTVYKLGQRLPGVWEMQLDLMRPEKAKSLREHGVL